MQSQNLATLVDMYQQRKQYVKDKGELDLKIVGIERRFEPTLELAMADLGFNRIYVKEVRYYYHSNNVGGTKGWDVLHFDSNEASLWHVEHNDWKEFEKYLKGQDLDYRALSTLSGAMAGIGFCVVHVFSLSTPINALVELLIGTASTAVGGLLGYVIGKPINDYLAKKIEDRKTKFQPIATGVSALEKVAELYEPKHPQSQLVRHESLGEEPPYHYQEPPGVRG